MSRTYKALFALAPREHFSFLVLLGGRDGALVRALTPPPPPHPPVWPDSIHGVDAICGLTLLMVLVPALRVFSTKTRTSRF